MVVSISCLLLKYKQDASNYVPDALSFASQDSVEDTAKTCDYESNQAYK